MKSSTHTNDRLAIYRAAVRAMRQGIYAIRIPAGPESDPLEQLGRELKKLAQRLEQRFDEYSRLHEVTTKINSRIFIDDVLDCVYETFHKIIPYDRIGCALISDDRTKARAIWARCNYSENIRISGSYTERLEGSSLGAIIETGAPRILNDLEAYLAAHPSSVSTRLIVAEGIRSSLTCPLIAEGKPVGFLFFSSREKNMYCDAHQSLFLHIASQVSCVIEKSRLYQQIYDLNQQLIESQQLLKEQASRDTLTGILNRGTILELLRQQLRHADRKKSPLAVIMVDVDHFKAINDTYGHPVGDLVLTVVARTIDSALRAYDRVGRVGGEEFLVILGRADVDTALDVAKRICEEVAAQVVEHRGKRLSVSVSLGVACRDHDGQAGVDQLLIEADAALYRAKREGRNRICLAAFGS